MSNPSLVIVIVEDDNHKMLVYRYLARCGLGPHAVRIQRSPSGQGSAANWVPKKFAEEVGVYRSRHAQTALIVMIDADTGTVEDRVRQLDQALRDIGKEVVDPRKERIARLIPRRNVETWVLCLNGHRVDEETDYKRRNDWNRLIPPAAESLFQWTRSEDGPPEYCVDSLRVGIIELRRLAS